ncbi:non-ribosomal peptide synthetase [Amycolatopsis xylanica]|uniref:non-ribosomal peptide synthetase n=1 Tax=Amycolatopsis xylanica TaxID=589385 RepID=UPI001FE01426|nr:amino acid adenylation domain-containing protein [Amycolatopsis xylanica]
MSETHVPLSFAQRRLWVLAQTAGAGSAYNEAMAFRLRGPLDRARLARAFGALVARHESLRTRLVSEDGEVRQVIDQPDVGFAFGDLGWDEPFDLSRGPLLRGSLAELGPDEHELLIVVHHVVYDGWSKVIMLRELGELYAGADLPPLTRQYSDYARWQHDWMASGEPDAQAAYWTERLAGAPPLIEVPADRPRPAEQDFRGGRVPVVLNEDLTAALGKLAAEHGATLYSTILTCWFILLGRLTSDDDIVVGVPAANRRRGDVADLVGFFVNTLALRLDLSGAPTGAEVLKRATAVLRDGLAHVDLPFERVVEVTNPPRSPAHTPLFQTMVAWVRSTRGLLVLPGIDAEPIELPDAPAKFDLALRLAEEGDRVVGQLEFATALFDRETVERYGRYFVHVLEQLAAEPDREVTAFALMDAAERRELLTGWSQGAPAVVNPGGLVDRFEAQVRARPDEPALVCGGKRLTYAELDRRANALAHGLIERGVGTDDVVGLLAGRSAGLVIGVLGILKAGAAYLPLDPAQPEERLASMVAEAALVLTDETLAGFEADRHDSPGIEVARTDLAYVIYTSGSTGRPKGVAVTHGSVLNLFDQWLAEFGATPGEATSAWSSIGFDASVHELLLPLTTGAVLHVVPEEVRGDPRVLLEWMREHGVVQAFLPPAYVKWIDEDPGRLTGLALRQVLTGVESLPEEALHRMRQALPGLRICFGYGPTEATLYATSYVDPEAHDRPCPIGRPLPGTRLYLLDDRLEPVPPGVAGEVYLAGASLARGYLNRPDLTAERFVADPFVPGERMYRTGDLARWLSDGNAQYAGRSDDQIKLRGFRIEPGEVEAALLALPGVVEAAVLHDTAGEPRLVAGVAPRLGHEWRTLLATRLPDYMIPAVFVELERLPLSRNGKLDRAALLEQAGAAPGKVNTASPRDHVELALHRIWRRLLVHPGIGITDNFFDVGGTSISAIKVAHAVREEFAAELPIQDIMRYPTIEALGARLRAGAGPATGGPIEFRAGDGRQRVICVHPAGGTAFCYLPLSAALPDAAGVLGLQSPGLNAGETPLPTVEAMAEEYLKSIDPRPDEDLVLCGLSYGGLVAYEMGRLLALRGHARVSVVLLDSRAADGMAVEPVDAAEFREKLVRFNGMYPGIEDDQVDRYFRIYNHNRMTARDYRPEKSAARLVFLQAGDDSGAAEFWRGRTDGGVLVEPVGCGHWEMLESAGLPRVIEVIEAELAWLREAR